MELPRLTGVLRAAFRGAETDLAKETLKRDRDVKALQKAMTKEAVGSGSLSWAQFVQGIEDPDENRSRKMRALYNVFLAELKDLVGDESSSGELHETAYVVFNILSDQSKSIQAKGVSLGKVLSSSPNNKVLTSLNENVSTLVEWKKSLAETFLAESAENLATNSNHNVQNREFGSDILFLYDAPDFLARPQKRVVIQAVQPQKRNVQPPPPPPQQQQQQQRQTLVNKEKPKAEDDMWLEEECMMYVEQVRSATNAAELFSSIVSTVRNAKSVDELQGQLFDLLGAEGIELMGKVIERRNAIKNMRAAPSGKGTVNSGATAAAASSVADVFDDDETSSGPYIPMSGNMTVTLGKKTQGQRKAEQKLKKQMLKQQQAEVDQQKRQQEKKNEPAGASGSKMDRYAEAIESGDRSALPLVGKSEDYVPGGSAYTADAKFHLPEGCKRQDTEEYESIWLPPKFPPFRSDDSLVPITEFEPWARDAFKGYTRLNRIQSTVFNSAYYSHENLLICAPTGAGKTNIAMLSILREIGLNRVNGVVKKDQFKIVYVAPMKALASEMTAGFSSRLRYLGISVRELTGDMQLTKAEIEETQIIVTTPEKWDVITRKSTDSPLTSLVRLLILDEVHLLNEDRGPVIETLVARTLRQVETTQSMIRIVGLSATLPNYKDVAQFMRVNESTGLHFFDGSFRPVPLEQTFFGVKAKSFQKQRQVMNNIVYDNILKVIKKGKQCMVFVHSRKETTRTAQELLEIAQESGTADLFSEEVVNGKHAEWARKEISKSRNSDVKRLFEAGFGCHHAGMLRADRNLVEKMFFDGVIKVLVCTATLAWGVNLPAHCAIIKGTQVYNAEKGGFSSLGMLDVMQVFGRAGRPQFDDQGSAIMITTHGELYRYLALVSHQAPIESQFAKSLVDNLNAEIVLGTVTNIQEAVTWLSYTYLFIRMLRNPMVYGISYEERQLDPMLVQKRTELIVQAANELDDVRMIRFNNPYFSSTTLGQTASHFYIHHDTIRMFNEYFEKASNNMTLPDVFRVVCNASEFENIISREEEFSELDKLRKICVVDLKGDPAGDKTVKVNILLQAYISRATVQAFALVCDTNFIAQNAARIVRGLFEIALRKGLPDAASLLLSLCKMIDLRLWYTLHPLRQFPQLKEALVNKLEQRELTVEKLLDMEASEISAITRVPAATPGIITCLEQIPFLEIETSVQPITRTIIRIKVTLTPNFRWNDRTHGQMQPFWVWVENPQEVGILHHEYFLLRKKEHRQPTELIFTTPITHPVPPQYILHVCSDRWLGSDNETSISFKHLILPQLYPPHTKLLDLKPLPISALKNAGYESLFSYKYFNPIQTQIFHTLYHTDQNVLIGAPTGSGKTVAAELAVLRLMNETPHLKAVYLGPLKALVQERLKDWDRKFVQKLGKKMVELTGEYTPDVMALKQADIICTTPEKWDGVSRSWQNRGYVKQVGLIIIDEIHLLGEDRGPILEVIVSRMRYISSQTETPVRILGLSTALANARDLAEWLGIEGPGLFNFHPSVRPVPLKIHVQGYEGQSYCPRMAKMNRPCYAAILAYSPVKPVIIFVSSRRQTRLTAVDLISHVAADGNPKRFVTGKESVLQKAIDKVHDMNLKHTLSFGIGLHHAGLGRDDKAIVEELFANCTIQVLISTATLAWGVNLPAHLVIVKGGEFFDPKTHRYVDYAITDILQMMGRAGRPQFDDSGEAVIMCTAAMKGFYKKFLYEPFPVESSLADVLHDHLNAEIVSGTITTKHDAIDYLTWTYLFRRVLMNPTYYGLESSDLSNVNAYFSRLVDDTLRDLEASHCLEIDEDNTTIYPLTLGQISSYYYLNHMTARLFFEEISEECDEAKLLQILCSAAEYFELPVRHSEDGLNEELAGDAGIRWPLQTQDWENPGVKANLLLQSHFSRILLPISDYNTDQKSVLDQAIRILQAMVDVSADGGWLFTTLKCMHLTQMIVQAQWTDQSSFYQLPFFDSPKQHGMMVSRGMESLAQLLHASPEQQRAALSVVMSGRDDRVRAAMAALARFPVMEMSCNVIADTSDKVYGKGDMLNVNVTLKRVSPKLAKGSEATAFAPMFGKHKREGWWLVCGDASKGEVLALKRVTLSSSSMRVALEVDLFVGHDDDDDSESDVLFEAQQQKPPKSVVQRELWLYLMSDSYIGLDMQIPLVVKQYK